MSTSTKSSEASWLTRVDTVVATWMDRHGRRLLRFALAVIFVWFGGLKLWLASPADDLVRRTIYWFSPDVFLPVLRLWEVAIGICLLFRPLVRWGLLLLEFQTPGTFLPLVIGGTFRPAFGGKKV